MSSEDAVVPEEVSIYGEDFKLRHKLWKANASRRRWRLLAIVAILALVAGSGYWAYNKYWATPTPAATATAPPVKMSDAQLTTPDGYLTPQIPAGATVGETEVYVRGSVDNAQLMYEQYFKYSGIKPDNPYIFSVSATQRDTWESKCTASGVANDHAYAFYCKADNIVWLPQLTLQKVWDGKALELDAAKAKVYRPAFAAAAVGVYVYGAYLIETLWMVADVPHRSRENDDLVATCFTGAWAGTDRALTEADLSGALSAIMRFTSPPPIRHTRAELSAAFLLAYKTGRPLECLNAYWPGFIPPTQPRASPSGSPSGTPPPASPTAK